jgi:hypothetical protein
MKLMKKSFLSILLLLTLSIAASSQTTKGKAVHTNDKSKTESTRGGRTTEVKSKKTTTIPQKINNAVRPKHKKYHGYKTKYKKTK